MIWVALALGLIGAFLCVQNWRYGIPLAILGGLLADPVRKLVPGEPVAFVITPLAMLAISFFARSLNEGPLPLWRIHLLRQLRSPLSLGAVWLVVSTCVSLARYHNPVMAAIGLLSYSAPLPALLIAHEFGLNANRARQALVTYVTATTVMEIGGYLSFSGYDWPILRQVGEGMTISSQGLTLAAYSGFFRAPELAAWHAATAICLLVVLVTSSWIRLPAVVTGALILFLIGAGIITGRRKMLAEVVLFLAVYGWLLIRKGKGAGRLGPIIVLTVAIAAFLFLASSATSPQIHPYVERGLTVFTDAPDRLQGVSVGAVEESVQREGFFGAGIGVASQGAQHFGRSDVSAGGAGERGIAKIASELGIPGVLVFLWILVLTGRYGLTLIRDLRTAPPQVTRFVYGVLALLVANLAAYVTAAQVFGDPFVLLLLGVFAGVMLAMRDRGMAITTAATPLPRASRPATVRAAAPPSIPSRVNAT